MFFEKKILCLEQQVFVYVSFNMFNMEMVDFEELLWLCFWFQTFFPFFFLLKICVLFGIWNTKFSLFQLIWLKIWKWANYYRGETFEKFEKNFLFLVSKISHVFSIKMNWKISLKSTISVLNTLYFTILSNFSSLCIPRPWIFNEMGNE